VFKITGWRKRIDKDIRDHLEFQIKETSKYEGAYILSKKPSSAQLWCAIANLSKQIFELNLKIKFLENALREMGGRKKEPELGKEELKKVLKRL